MKYLLTILGISFCLSGLLGQGKSLLELEKQKLKREIEKTSKVLKQTDQKINDNMEHYNLLESQIYSRKKYIGNIETQLSQTSTSILKLEDQIEAYKVEINNLEGEYNQVLQSSYVSKLSQNFILDLLSSTSISDAYKKWVFSKQYSRFLSSKKQALELSYLKLDSSFLDLKTEEINQKQLLEDKRDETQKLNLSLKEKDRLLANLEKKQAGLKIELLAKRKRQKLINEEIEKIIKAELSKAKNEAGKSKEENIVLSGNFDSNRGKFLLPLESGNIIGRFGEQAHPDDPGLTIVNNGIDIKKNKTDHVKAIFEGVVVGETFIPGAGNMLILRHGNYYSVYSRLNRLYVKRGDQIQTGQQIGQVEESLHFEIWNGKEKVNPEYWLR